MGEFAGRCTPAIESPVSVEFHGRLSPTSAVNPGVDVLEVLAHCLDSYTELVSDLLREEAPQNVVEDLFLARRDVLESLP